ncbi:MAG: hypothetical protein ABFS22_07110 [Pseudomonadota bacterium]
MNTAIEFKQNINETDPGLINPLIDARGISQTAHNVSCVLQYLKTLDHDKEAVGEMMITGATTAA